MGVGFSIRIGGVIMTELEKSKIRSLYNRINSNVNYAKKLGLEQTNYHVEFQQMAIRFGVKFTKSGNISKESGLTIAQLKSLEKLSKISSKFAKKYGSTKKTKVIKVQKFLNTKIQYIYEKIKNADNEEEFQLSQKFDAMLEDGLRAYDYDEIYNMLNKLDAFNTSYEYNPFLDKYPSRGERRKMKFDSKKKKR